MVDKISTAAEALAGVKDGSLVAMNVWGTGTPFHLLQALKNQGAKDLTLYINNYVQMADELIKLGVLDATILLPQTRKIISSFSKAQDNMATSSREIARRVREGTLEFENMSHGMFPERLYAGAMRLGGIYSPIGIGTNLEKGKEKRTINGVDYLFLEPIVPDVGLIIAAKADKLGNLVYHGTARASNPLIAMASRYTVAEVYEIVEPGELDPDAIVTPGVFVDRIVRIPDDDYSRTQKVWRILRQIEFRMRIEAEKAKGGKL
jgi:3-oxoadipate CoA-transferase alpha subunit